MSTTRALSVSVTLLVFVAVASAVSVDAASRCGGTKTHPFVGFKGKLSMLEHGVGGEVEILDDCTFRVTGFRYDGRAPAAYWWGSKTPSRNDLGNGFMLAPLRLVNAVNNVEMTIELNAGLTWNGVAIISVWCEAFSANFGDIVLANGPATAAVAPAKAPAAAVPVAGAAAVTGVRTAPAPAPGPSAGAVIETGSAALAMAAAAPSCTNGNKACAPTTGRIGTAP